MDLYEGIINRKKKIAVIGLGYVGLPIALAFSNKANVIGFDINKKKVEAYQSGKDPTGEVGSKRISSCTVEFTYDSEKLKAADFFIIAVPTPVNKDKAPNLEYLVKASQLVGRNMKKGAVVVYESTVYPGVTEELCIPVLEIESQLQCQKEFKVGYSPERINPGDSINRLENIVKIVSGVDDDTLELIAKIYELIIEAGVYRAESIKVAEAAKVIENAQRDINIAFMNELSMLFNTMGIDTQSVLKAAGTKWNFLNFTPGLVGGHCIGIDPYYLTYKAEYIGYHSKIILAGRQINDSMGNYISENIIKLMIQAKVDLSTATIGFMGITYKENCSDSRNSKVIDIINEIKEYDIKTIIYDPLVDKDEVLEEYSVNIEEESNLKDLNIIVVAVGHNQFRNMTVTDFDQLYIPGQQKILIDIKGIYNKKDFEQQGYIYWRL